MGRSRARLIAIAIAIGLGALAVLCAGCHRPRGLHVPRATGPIRCDGELGEPSWPQRSVHTGPFLDAGGKPAAPYSDARFLRDQDHLYLALYAGDENLSSTSDAFDVELEAHDRRVTITFPIRGAPTSTLAGLEAGVDTDGTIDDPSDDDEEWIVEASLPLRELGVAAGGRLHVAIRRCDVPKDGVRRCGSWNGLLLLDG